MRIAVIIKRNATWEIWSDLCFLTQFPRAKDAEAWATANGYAWMVRA